MTIPTVLDNRGGLRKLEVKRPGSAGIRLPPLPVNTFGKVLKQKQIRKHRGAAHELGITLIGKRQNFDTLTQILRTPPVSARGSRKSSRAGSATKKRHLTTVFSREDAKQPNINPTELSLRLENLQSSSAHNYTAKLTPIQPVGAENVSKQHVLALSNEKTRVATIPNTQTEQTQPPPIATDAQLPNSKTSHQSGNIAKPKINRHISSDLDGVSRLFGGQERTGKERIGKERNTAKLVENTAQNEQKIAVWKGQYALNKLPPLPKKVVRIFISSTFTDTAEERNALMQYVYPKLSEYCREQHGLEFQVVDMRWGVPEQASDNHSTTDLCIQEIKKCQEVSVGPNFVAIVGDKYGYRPIPSSIDESVFNIFGEIRSNLPGVDWTLLNKAYKTDTNSMPPVYVLQRISTMVPEYSSQDPEMQQKAYKEWQNINGQLTRSLRTLADKAFNMDKISEAQKQIFMMSVTEREITEGVLQTQEDPSESCVCIIRKIVDILNNLSDVKAPRFIDVADLGTIDEEARELLGKLREQDIASRIPIYNQLQREIDYDVSGAKLSLEKFRSVNIDEHAKQMQLDKVKVEQHASYLESLCDDFFMKITSLIKEGSWKQRRMYDDFTAELLQHWHLAKLRCDVFEGRTEELAQAHAFISSPTKSDSRTGPLVIYGHSGCGKTSVLAKVMECVASGQWIFENRTKFNIIARFLGTTPNTCNLHQLLSALCKQLVNILDVQKWEEPEKVSDLIKEFHTLLGRATKSQPIMLILDSIDQLMPAYNAYKVKWLPKEVPENVKIVLSTIVEGYPIYDALQNMYKDRARFIEIKQLGEKLGLEIIYLWLKKDNRTMTKSQEGIIVKALHQCSLPLYARIAYDHIQRWKSYDTPLVSDMETTVRGAINKLFQTMEDKFGSAVVKHCLAYLTASRYGLSEVELEHILSLDDTLLNKIFKFWKPPVRRVPPLIWTRVRTEIHSYIVERSADDTIVLYWYHRQFIEATKARYLSEPQFVKQIHRILADFFMGKWGGGQEKPFKYTDAQTKRFRLSSPISAEDRKVPLQPYTFKGSDESTGISEIRPNKRKLSELPFQLVKCNDYENLKKHAFFNYEFLHAKIMGTSPQQLVEELELFIHSDKLLKKDIELKLLFVNLQLIKTYITRFPNSLSYELVGRLARYIGNSPAITELIKGCCTAGLNHCSILPLGTCFESADMNLSQSINFRSTEPWEEGGAFCFSHDFKTVYIIDYDDSGIPLVRVFDAGSGDKLNDVYIIKSKPESQKDTIDVYFQLHMLADKNHVLAVYKQKYVVGMRHVYRNYGLADIINITSGQVTKTIEEPLRKNVHKTYNNPVIYITPNWLCMKLGWKMPIYSIHSDKVVTLKKATYLNPNNERFFVMCGQAKTQMNVFETKQLISEFDAVEKQLAVAANSDMSLIAMIGSATKQIRIYDLQNKHLHTSESKPSRGNMLKCSRWFDLEHTKVMLAIEDIYAGIVEAVEEGDAGEAIHSRIAMEFSPNDHHLMVIFQGGEEWQAFLWDAGRRNTKYVGPVTPRMPIAAKHPKFNCTGECLVFAEEQKIVVVSCETGNRIREFPVAGTIKDISTSRVSDKLAVMLDKSVVLMNISSTDMSETSRTAKHGQHDSDKAKILMKRSAAHEYTHKEVVLKRTVDGVVIQEIEDPVLSCNTDRVGTSRSRKKQALEVRPTPDGQRVIHLHSAMQVLDTQNDKIACTPKKGDVIVRQSKTSTTNIEIPGLEDDSEPTTVDLLQGDRIVSESNKIKLRVDDSERGRFKIMMVPSLITVYSSEENKLKRLQRITVYQETILAISNHYIVTSKDTGAEKHCNIYKQQNGKLIVSHNIPHDFARFSCDEALLFIVDDAINIHAYEAPTFVTVELQISAKTMDNQQRYVIKDVITFAKKRYEIVLQYRPEGVGRTSRVMYQYVNCTTRQIATPIEVSPGFEDISKDGQLAIDSELNVYNLQQGRKITQLTKLQPIGSSQLGDMQLRARLSDDNRYVVVVDKNDDTLHVIRLSDDVTNHVHVASCYTHSPNIALSHGLEIRHFGRIITLRAHDSVKIIALMDKTDANLDHQRVVYHNEVTWILSQLENIAGLRGQAEAFNNDSRNQVSVYEQREIILRSEKDETEVKVEPFKKKESSKPSVLIIAGPLLGGFRAKRFTHHLDVQKVSITLSRSASWVQDAVAQLSAIRMRYDCIIVHAISDDVRRLGVAKVVAFMQDAVTAALERAEAVIVSLPPGRAESNPELNQKALEVNSLIRTTYNSHKSVTVCDNSNMTDGGKLTHKYFRDQNTLTSEGLTQISMNLKEATFHALRDDYYIKTKMAQGLL